jgi:hypothetical protein
MIAFAVLVASSPPAAADGAFIFCLARSLRNTDMSRRER